MNGKKLKNQDYEEILVSIKNTVDDLPTKGEFNNLKKTVDNLPTCKEMDGKLNKLEKKLEKKFDKVNKRIDVVIDGNDQMIGKFVKLEQESAAHTLTYKNHDKRIEKLELQAA